MLSVSVPVEEKIEPSKFWGITRGTTRQIFTVSSEISLIFVVFWKNSSQYFILKFVLGIRVTDLQPGDVKTNLIMNNDDPEAAEKVGVLIGQEVGIATPREQVLDVADIVETIRFAIKAPPHVGVEENN